MYVPGNIDLTDGRVFNQNHIYSDRTIPWIPETYYNMVSTTSERRFLWNINSTNQMNVIYDIETSTSLYDNNIRINYNFDDRSEWIIESQHNVTSFRYYVTDGNSTHIQINSNAGFFSSNIDYLIPWNEPAYIKESNVSWVNYSSSDEQKNIPKLPESFNDSGSNLRFKLHEYEEDLVDFWDYEMSLKDDIRNTKLLPLN